MISFTLVSLSVSSALVFFKSVFVKTTQQQKRCNLIRVRVMWLGGKSQMIKFVLREIALAIPSRVKEYRLFPEGVGIVACNCFLACPDWYDY
jgi:hypothetical protein